MDLLKKHWELTAYIVLVLVFTFPMITDPINLILGHDQATAGCHIWVLWWAQQGMSNIETDLIFYPNGADVVLLYGSDVLSPVIFSWIPIPPTLLYNFWVVFLMVLGAVGCQNLAKHFAATRGGAFVAGVVFCSAPFFQHELLNGTSEIVAAAFLPWFTLHQLQLLKKPHWKTALKLGLFAGLAVTSSVYNAFFLMVITACILTHRACTDVLPILNKSFLQNSAFSIAAFAPFFYFVVVLHLQHGGAQTLERRENWLDIGMMLPDSFADLTDWINPAAANIPERMPLPNGSFFEYWTTCTVYLGWSVIGLAVYAWWKQKKPRLGVMFLLVFVSVLIAMGPYLRINGEVLMIQGNPLYLPLYTIGYLFPLISVSALHAYRYAAIAVVALSTIVGRGVHSAWWAVLIIAECLLLSPVPYPAAVTKSPQSEALQALREAEQGAVLFAPLAKENLHDISLALLSQTQHQKPFQDGGIHRRAGESATKLFAENPLVEAMSERQGANFIDEKTTQLAITNLKEKGFRYILVPSEAPKVQQWYETVIGPPTAQDEHWSWFTLK